VLGVLLPLLLLLAGILGCARKLKFDAARLERRCGVTAGRKVDAEQARCIARVAGLRDGRKCPLRSSQRGAGAGLVYRFEESCAEVAIEIEAASGRVVAVALGEGAAPPSAAGGS
jgi:hypothetical protein